VFGSIFALRDFFGQTPEVSGNQPKKSRKAIKLYQQLPSTAASLLPQLKRTAYKSEKSVANKKVYRQRFKTNKNLKIKLPFLYVKKSQFLQFSSNTTFNFKL